MGKIFYYDVYDGSRIVLEHVTSKEIQEHFGTDYPNLSYYTGGKAYYMCQYLIVGHGTGEPKPPKGKPKAVVRTMPEEWKEEWRAVCSRLRGTAVG